MLRDDKSFLTGIACRVGADPSTGCSFYYDDPACGDYGLDEGAWRRLDQNLVEKRKIASVLAVKKLRGFYRDFLIVSRRNDAFIPINDKWTFISIDDLLERYPADPLGMIEESLVNLSKLVSHPSDGIEITGANWWVFYSYDSLSSSYMIGQLAILDYVSQWHTRTPPELKDTLVASIQAKGWEKISDLRSSSNSEINQAFVAMWFDPQTTEIYEKGIKPAIEHDGTKCIRIDYTEHNRKICDEIISEIRKSKYVVVDVSGDRKSVYFEAGYAIGRGIEVIWTIKEEDLKSIVQSFDTRQYNHVSYSNAEDLRTKLRNRISATIR